MDRSPRRSLLPYRWELIVLLWLAYFFCMADRQVFSVVLPKLKEDLGLDEVQAGLVASIFMWAYAILVPVAGYVGDVFRCKWIVFWGLLVWSTATLLSGASGGLVALVIFRSLATGGGEAFYYPAANSLISQCHHRTRALAMSVHQTAVYVGMVASGFIAGWIAEQFNWRWSFYVFGAFGVVLAAIILWRLKDTGQAGAEDALPAGPRLPLMTVLKAIGRKPTVWALCLAFGGFQFVGWSCNTWMPTFLYEKFGLSLAQAGFSSMFYSNLGAPVGVLLAGKLSDAWAPRRRSLRMEIVCLGLVLGAPFVYMMGVSDRLIMCYIGLVAFGLFRGVCDSNLFPALFDVIEPRYRASATGIVLAMGFAFGALGPIAVGWAKTQVGPTAAIAFLSVIFLASAAVLLLAAKTTFARDYFDESGEKDATADAEERGDLGI